MLASLACAHGQFAARRALCSYREGIRVPWGLRLGPFCEVVAGLRRALSPTPYSCPFLGAHQATQPVHVDRQHGQAHHQREVLRTLLPPPPRSPKLARHDSAAGCCRRAALNAGARSARESLPFFGSALSASRASNASRFFKLWKPRSKLHALNAGKAACTASMIATATSTSDVSHRM